MAAAEPERLFSLELVVDWVRLETASPPPVVATEEEQEAAGPSPPCCPRSPCPAVAFRLLDFPTLLVYPPGGPTARAPQPQPGLLSFGRGKSCLFRMHRLTLHSLLLRSPLYAMLLRLPPGRPAPAPQLVGACSVSLGSLAHGVLGPSSSGCTQGCTRAHRGSFSLRNEAGELVGTIALAYRLSDLGSALLGHLGRPVTSVGVGVEGIDLRKAVEVSSESRQEKQSTLDSNSAHAARSLVGLKAPKTRKEVKEVVIHRNTNPAGAASVGNGISSAVSSSSQEITELDIEANIFCPPPLYYTHLPLPKTPPVQYKITIKPQVSIPEESDGTLLEEKLANPPRQSRHLKQVNLGTHTTPPVLVNPPHVQSAGDGSQTNYHPQSEQDRNSVSQLPLLNALLVELSLLCNQPMATPTPLHPHLSWLYRSENKKSPDAHAEATFDSAKKDKLCADEKTVSPHYKKNQVENLKKGQYFEKSRIEPKRVTRGKLLYGLTNTLKLRLKQTNPAMLVVHEKREQYRKMQAQILGAKPGNTSSKIKVLNFTKQKEHQVPKDKYLESSFSENNDTSKQTSRGFDTTRSTKEAKLKCAAEKTADGSENRTDNGSLETKGYTNSTVPGRLIQTSILGENIVQNVCAYQQVEDVNRIVVEKEIHDRNIKVTDNDFLTADISECKSHKNSCSESISELKYSDDFTSTCYSEDSYSTTSRILPACPRAETSKHSQCTHTSSETRLSIKKTNSEKSSILSPPFSVGSPVHSSKRSHVGMNQDKNKEDLSSISSDLSLSYSTEEKENDIGQSSMHHSKFKKMDQDISNKLKTRTDYKSLERSHSPQTSPVSSYLSSNLTELKHNALDSSVSDNCEEDSVEIASLNTSKQCKDICDLVINKLPGYTM